jgi:hypothetical protein
VSDRSAHPRRQPPHAHPRAPRGERQRHDGVLQRAAALLVPAENPAGLIYGVIAIGALLAAESGQRETYAETIGAALVAALLYWLTHAYAGLLGRRLSTGERLSASRLARELVHDWAIVRGACVPVAVMAVAWAAGAAQATAVSAALWSAIASLVVFELAAAARSRATHGELVLELGVGLALGVAIVSLKILID